MKALFITHDISLYGAAQSLRLLLANLKNVEVDLVIPKRLTGRNDLRSIKERFGPAVVNIYEFYLPFDLCYEGNTRQTPLYRLKEALWRANKNKLYAFIGRGGYDFIHLNSLVLHPLIRPDWPFVIHVREVLDVPNGSRAKASLKAARAVIFIDEATRRMFHGLRLNKSLVLNNPFDMSALRERKYRSDRLAEHKTVFSLIGRIMDNKGTEFIINSFRQLKAPNVQLAVVGMGGVGEDAYVDKCKNLAANDERIIFWGEEKEIAKIYALSDYIIRGEAYPCVGRTIYEGLYAGCDVIVPGEQTDSVMFFEYEKFKNKIHFYPPRQTQGLTGLLQRLAGRKIINKSFHSNIAEYEDHFRAFINELVGPGATHG